MPQLAGKSRRGPVMSSVTSAWPSSACGCLMSLPIRHSSHWSSSEPPRSQNSSSISPLFWVHCFLGQPRGETEQHLSSFTGSMDIYLERQRLQNNRFNHINLCESFFLSSLLILCINLYLYNAYASSAHNCCVWMLTSAFFIS